MAERAARPDKPLGIGVCRNVVELFFWIGRPQPVIRYLDPQRARRVAELLVEAADAAEKGQPWPVK